MPGKRVSAAFGLATAVAVGVAACGGSHSGGKSGKPNPRAALLARVNPICVRDNAAIRESEAHLASGYTVDTLRLIRKETRDMGAVLFKDKSDARDNRFYTHVLAALSHVVKAIAAAETPGAGSGVAPSQLLAAQKSAFAVGIQCSFGAPGR